MNETIVKFEGVLERLMADALKDGMTPVQVFESVFGKAVNRALGNNVSPAMICFELKTCEQQLVGMAIQKARQNQTVIHALNDAGVMSKNGRPFPPTR